MFFDFLNGGQQQQQQNQQNQHNFSNNMNNLFEGVFSQFPNIFGQQQFQNQNQQNSQQQYHQQQSQQNYQQPDMEQENIFNDHHNNSQNSNSRAQFRNTRSQIKLNKPSQEKQKKKKTESNPQSKIQSLRQLGNTAFQQGDYDKAIQYYTQGINEDSSQSVFYSNRGRCYKIKKNYQQALKDAQSAVELDEKNIKGYLLIGQCQAELSKNEEGTQRLDNAIKKMTKALTLCSSQAGDKKSLYERELSIYILRAKKLLWYKNLEIHKKNKLQVLSKYKDYLRHNINTQEEIDEKYKQFLQMVGDPNAPLNFVIPDYLCCKITLDLIEDPVTTESGHTYEREVIEEHIKKNGNIDPVTRKQISGVLYPNLAVKQGIDDFLLYNPWAFEYQPGEKYEDIQF